MKGKIIRQIKRINSAGAAVWLVLAISNNLFWLAKNGNGRADWLTVMGQWSAIIGASLLATTIILSSKMGWVDKLSGGMDKSLKIHHFWGRGALMMLLIHPLSLAARLWPNWDVVKNYWLPGNDLGYNLGIASLYILIILLVFTLVIKIPYSKWLKSHRLMVIPLLLGIGHILIIGSDVGRFWPLRAWMLGLMGMGIWSYIFSRSLFEKMTNKTKFKIEKVIRKQGLIELYLRAETEFKFKAGQYGLVKLEAEGISGERHPFSFSSGPEEELVRLSIKIEGNYTRKLKKIEKGTKLTIFGPYGNFGEDYRGNKEVIFIAGGIGVTPFLSMIQEERENPEGRKILMFYSVRNREEAYYEAELRQAENKLKNFELKMIYSDESGRLKSEEIERMSQGVKNKLIFMCGPKEMMNKFREEFIKIGAKKEDIRFEDFSFK